MSGSDLLKRYNEHKKKTQSETVSNTTNANASASKSSGSDLLERYKKYKEQSIGAPVAEYEDPLTEEKIAERRALYQSNADRIADLETTYKDASKISQAIYDRSNALLYGAQRGGNIRATMDEATANDATIAELKKQLETYGDVDALKKEMEELKAANLRYQREQRVLDDYFVPRTEEFLQNAAYRDYGNPTIDDIEAYYKGTDLAPTELADKLGFYLNDYSSIHDEILARQNNAISKGEDYRTVMPAEYVGLAQEGRDGSWEYLKDKEIDIYYNLLKTEGQEAAYKFLDAMQTILNKRATQAMAQQVADAGVGAQIAYNVASVPANVLGGAGSFIDDALHMIRGEDINPYSYAHRWQNFAQAVREDTASDINEWTGNAALPYVGTTFGDVYQALMSGVDSAVGIGLGGTTYGILMGMGAASSEAKELYEKGASMGQIAAGGILAGAAEMVFEKYSIDKFVKMGDTKTVATIFVNALKQGGVEASEEVLTEIANTLSDAVVMGSQSDWQGYIDKYIAEGYSESEATVKALFNDVAPNVINAGIGGLISGGAMGSIGSTGSYFNYQNRLKSHGQSIIDRGGVDTVKALADDMAGVKAVSKASSKVGSKASAKNVGGLSVAIEEAMSAQNKADIESALVEKGLSKSEAKRVTAYLTSTAELTEEQQSEIKNNKQVAEVVTELVKNPSSVLNQRKLNLMAARLGVKLNDKKVTTTGEVAVNKELNLKDKISAKKQTTNEATGEAIVIDKNNAIAKVEDGKVYYNTDKGVVPLTDVTYANEEEGVLYEGLSDLNPAIANALISNYDGKISARAYVNGAREGILLYGKNNFQAVGKDIPTDTYFADLSEADQAFALKLGKTYSKMEAEQKGENLKTAIKNAAERAEADKSSGKQIAEGKIRFESNVDGGKLNRTQRRTVSLAKHLAKAIGIDIVFYDATKTGTKHSDSNGYFDPKDNSIHLDLQNAATDSKTIAFTLSHELVHFIKKWSPAKFKAFADFLMEQYAIHGVSTSTLLANKMAALNTTDADYAYEEMIADACERMLLDSNAVVKLMELRKSDLELFEKVKLHILQLLNKIRNAFKGVDPNTEEGIALQKMEDVLGKLHEMFEDAAVDAAKTYGEASKYGAREVYREARGLEIGIKKQVKRATDKDYLDAVNRGDMETAQRMVDEAAKAAGYNSPKLYHGTKAFGFTQIKTEGVEEGVGWSPFFVANNKEISASYVPYGKVRDIRSATDEDAIEEMRENEIEKRKETISDLIGDFRYLVDRYISPWVFGQSDNSYLESLVEEANPEAGYGDGVYDVLSDVLFTAFYDYRDDFVEYEDADDWIENSQDAQEMVNKIIEIEGEKSAIHRLEVGEKLGGIYELYANLENMYIVDGKGAAWNQLRPDGLPKLERGAYKDVPYKTRDVADWARMNGYDGVIFRNIKDNGPYGRTPAGDVYTFFKPESQVKSADPVTYDDEGNVIPLSKRFNAENNDIRYQKKTSYAPTFYSQMGKVIDAIKMEKIGSASIVNYLKGKGIKNDEIKWSGIEAFLEGKKSVTKAELHEFVAASMLQIEETIIDNTETPMTKERKDKIASLEGERNTLVRRVKSEWKRVFGTDELDNYAGEALPCDFNLRITNAVVSKKMETSIGQEYKAAQEAMKQICEESDYFGYDNAKQAYVEVLRNPYGFLSGGEYTADEEAAIIRLAEAKEAWLGLKDVVPASDVQSIKDLGEDVERLGHKIYNIRAEHRAEQQLPRWGSYKLKGGENYREMVFKIPGSNYTNEAMETHWREFGFKGVLAHARIQDFDVDGKKMLFIEEIQSDWHNEGHTEGYGDPKKATELKLKALALDDENKAERSSLKEILAKHLDGKVDNPEAAAFNILDFASNDRNNSIYVHFIRKYDIPIDLVLRINKLRKSTDEANSLHSEAYDLERGVPDAPFRNNYHEYVLKRLLRMAVEEGYDSIGWTPADIQSERWSDEYAEGYRIEYDQDIPKFLRKYGKKWGATVGNATLNGDTEIWSMDITDSMKESVLYEGQPMFQKKTTTNRTLLANALESEAKEGDERNALRNYQTILRLEEKENESLRSLDERHNRKQWESPIWRIWDTDDDKLYSFEQLNDMARELIDDFTKKVRHYTVSDSYENHLYFVTGYDVRLKYIISASEDSDSYGAYLKSRKEIENRIKKYQNELHTLYQSEHIHNVLKREQAKYQNQVAEKGKEAFKKYREKVAEQNVIDMREKYRKWRSKASVSRSKTKLKGDTRKLVASLTSLLENGNKKRNIKTEEHKVVTAALELAKVLLSNDLTNEDIVRLGVKNATKEELALLDEYKAHIVNLDAVNGQIAGMQTDEKLSKEGYALMDELEATKKDIKEEMSTLSRKLSDLFARERFRLNETKIEEFINALFTEYSVLAKSDKAYIKNAYREEVKDRLANLKTSLGDKIARDMDIYQLTELYDTLKMIEKMVRVSNKLFIDGKLEDLKSKVSAVEDEVMSATDTPKEYGTVVSTLESAFREFSWNNLRPIDAFERLGSPTLEKLFWDFVDGMTKAGQIIRETGEAIYEARTKYGYSKWKLNEVSKTFTTRDGLVFKPTLADKLSIYAYSQREQAEKHMLDGGFVFDTGATYKEVEDGKTYVRKKLSQTYRMDDITIGSIIASLTQEQRDYVDAILPIFTALGEMGNEVSDVMYGIDLFKEKVYFPLKTSADYRSSTSETLNSTPTMSSMTNSGFTKQTVPNADNAIVLRAFDDVTLEHIEKMANWVSLVLPIENLRKVFENVSREEDRNSKSIKSLIGERYGVEAQKYFEQWITDINGGVVPQGAKSFLGKMFSRAKAMSVSANLSVVAQQYSSIFRAMELVDPKYFTPFINKEARVSDEKAYDELIKYAPITIIKEMGGFDVGSGHNAKSYIGDKGARMDAKHIGRKIGDVSMWGASLMDKLGWVTIWKAIKAEVAKEQKLKVGTDEFFEACKKRFTEVIVKTQVFDSVASRSGYMRSQNDLVKFSTSFLGEPTAIMGRMFVSTHNLVRAIKSGDKAEIKSAAAHFGRTMSVIAVSGTLANLAKALIYAGRDDDEDKAFFEKWSSNFAEALENDLNPLNSLPFTRDIMSAIEGWDVERPDMTLIAELVTSIKRMLDGEPTLDDLLNLTGSVGNFFGIPLKNVIREIKSVITVVDDIFDDVKPTDVSGAFIEGITGKKRSTTELLYRAMVNKDKGKVNAIRSGYKTESAYLTALRTALRENDPRIAEAVVAWYSGDVNKRVALITEIEGEKNFTPEIVRGTINAEINRVKTKTDDAIEYKKKGEVKKHDEIVAELLERYPKSMIEKLLKESLADFENKNPSVKKEESIYLKDDINTALEGGDITLAKSIISELIDTKVANGMEEKNAKSSVKSSMTSYWNPLVIEAYKSKNASEKIRIRDLLYETGLYGKTRKEVKEAMDKWYDDYLKE